MVFGGFFAQIPGEFNSPTGRLRVFLGQTSSELGALGLRQWCLSPTLTPVPPLRPQAVHEQKRRIQQTPGFHRLTLGSLGGGTTTRREGLCFLMCTGAAPRDRISEEFELIPNKLGCARPAPRPEPGTSRHFPELSFFSFFLQYPSRFFPCRDFVVLWFVWVFFEVTLCSLLQ